MQANLGDRPGDGLQRLVEPIDWKGRGARPGIGLDSCFQHVNIVSAALSALSAAPTLTLLALVEQTWFPRSVDGKLRKEELFGARQS